ncbi:MAG: ABC transporter substrate-binding protein [Bacillota bacterium]
MRGRPVYLLKKSMLVALVLAMAGFLVACGRSKPPAPGPTAPQVTKGGVLRVSYASDPTSLDVHNTPSVGSIHAMLHATPVIFGPDSQYHPYYVESWQVAEDGKSITFKLRDGIILHDGTPLDAQLVAYNNDRLMEKSPHGLTVLGRYERTDVIDRLTYRLVFAEPYSPVFNGLSISYTGVQSKAAIEKYGAEYGHAGVVGIGPFKLDSWISGDKIILTRNPDFTWGPRFYKNTGPAYFERVEWYNMPDETTRILALKNNEIDITEIPTHAVDDMKNDPNIQIFQYTPTSVVYLGINSSKKPWSDVRLRQAIAHVVDRDLLVRVGLDGHAVANPTPLSPSAWGFDQTLYAEAFPKDINRAKQLLAEAGWRDTTGDGWVNDDKGQPLTLEIWTYTTAPYPRVTEVVREMIIQAGIQVKITTLESATLLARTPEGAHDAILIAYGWPDPDVFNTFLHSSRLDRANRVHYVNPTLDAMLEKQRTIVDPVKRFGLIREIQLLIMNEAPWIPLYTPLVNLGVRREVKDFALDPRGNFLLMDAYKEVR